MSLKFIEVDRETLYLLPPSVQDWLPERHLARFVVEIVDQLDLRSLKNSYAGRGSQPYNPEMLLALLFYLIGANHPQVLSEASFQVFCPTLQRQNISAETFLRY